MVVHSLSRKSDVSAAAAAADGHAGGETVEFGDLECRPSNSMFWNDKSLRRTSARTDRRIMDARRGRRTNGRTDSMKNTTVPLNIEAMKADVNTTA